MNFAKQPKSKKILRKRHRSESVRAQSQASDARRAIPWPLLISIALAASIFLIYAPASHFDFVNYDDDLYVSANRTVQAGLTAASIRWAFSTVDLYYWQPLTWLSHMLDCQLFGLNPGAHHLVNIVLHAVNSILLFLLLRRMTKTLWRSALVTAFFALHPLRVESVAWVAERKDVLSALFWIVTVGAYYSYAKDPSRKRYLLVILGFALALMTKPMVVTLPCILLVLDYWPLGRWEDGWTATEQLVKEKIPLFALSIVVAALTLKGQAEMGAVANLPLASRLANASSAYVQYLGMLVWPMDLSVLYPYRLHLPAAWIAFCCGVLAVLTVVAVLRRGRQPYMLAGWLWYLIALVPTVGLIQAGPQSFADRFTYIPSIGIFIVVVWWAAEQTLRRRSWQMPVTGLAILCVTALAVRSAAQVQVWRNSLTLFSHAAEFAPGSAIVQHNLGYALAADRRYDEAIPHYRAAIQLDSNLYRAHYNLGRALYEQGRISDAIREFESALRSGLAPDYEGDVRNALGIALTREGDAAHAAAQFERAVQLKPRSPEIHANFGSFLAMEGKLPDAVREFRRAVELNAGYTEAHRNLGRALAQMGQRAEALQQFQTVLKQSPGDSEAQARISALSSAGSK